MPGGALCLDFVNTVDPRHRLPSDDFLEDYRALVEWAAQAGAIGAAEARALATVSRRQPAAAAKVHRRAIALREALYELLRPGRAGSKRRRANDTLNQELQRAMRHAVLEPAGGGFHLGWAASADLDRPLWRVAHSAADLLTSSAAARIRECEGEGCGWLFLDVSATRRRRWCSMAVCGNRAKAQRHRARVKEGLVAPRPCRPSDPSLVSGRRPTGQDRGTSCMEVARS
jgi:predicted RNA-binding Zn ribbon-like protein